MQARNLSRASPIQYSLRIRHPHIDPKSISTRLGLPAEHCFKAGDPRPARARGGRQAEHTQTYWLAPLTTESWGNPLDPKFLSAIAARNAGRETVVSAKLLQAASRDLTFWGIEAVLLYFLRRLSEQQPFLLEIQSEGGDVSILLILKRDSAADFTLPPSVARMLAQLGIAIEFIFDS